MQGSTYALVLLSATGHAYWNFLLKRSGATQVIVGSSKITEAVILAPLLLGWFGSPPAQVLASWWLPAIGALLVLLNYLLLSAAYRHGDLSLAYPVSRGAMLVFLPPLAFLTIGERLTAAGWIAIFIIVLGIALLQRPRFEAPAPGASGRSLGAPAMSYALLAALVAACYTIWDKRAIQTLSPLTYFAAYTVLVGLAYGLVLHYTAPAGALREAWRLHWTVIVQVAILNSGSYLLALAALKTGKASYVIALRQLSIPLGAVLGWRLLGETLPPPRRVGAGLIVTGCVLLALAR